MLGSTEMTRILISGIPQWVSFFLSFFFLSDCSDVESSVLVVLNCRETGSRKPASIFPCLRSPSRMPMSSSPYFPLSALFFSFFFLSPHIPTSLLLQGGLNNRNRSNIDYPLFGLELDAFMWAITDSETCLRRREFVLFSLAFISFFHAHCYTGAPLSQKCAILLAAAVCGT